MNASLPAAFFFSIAAAVAPAQNIYIVGDSLPYDGRLLAVIGGPGAPYVGGRYSDGPVFSEQLAEATGRTPLNFAFPGSTTADVFASQVMPLVLNSGNNLPADGLYVYWAGANDLLGLLSGGGGDPQQIITNAMGQTANALGALIGAGAQDIVVLNLPDLSLTPRVLALGDPASIASVEALVTAYNQALDYTLGQIEAMTLIDITTVDTFALLNDIAATPKSYMLHVVDRPRMLANGTTWPRAQRFLFFDDIHPTFGGHRAVMWAVMRDLGQTIPGDVNGDNLVNIVDNTAIWQFYGPCSATCAADLDGNQFVDSRDRQLLLTMLAMH